MKLGNSKRQREIRKASRENNYGKQRGAVGGNERDIFKEDQDMYKHTADTINYTYTCACKFEIDQPSLKMSDYFSECD